jgi:hypothetical protein
MKRITRCAAAVLLLFAPAAVLLLFTPSAMMAQEAASNEPDPRDKIPRWEVGAAVIGSLLVGDASDFLDGGLGILGAVGRAASGPLWIRADVSYLGLDADASPSERADNAILSLGVGPELGVGWPGLRFYLRGSAGLMANFQSRSRLSLPEETTWAGMLGGGLGIRIRLSSGSHPVALDLGGDVFKTGELAFARSSESGGVSNQELGIITLRAGLTVGLP